MTNSYKNNYCTITETVSPAMAERPRELGDFKAVGQFKAKF